MAYGYDAEDFFDEVKKATLPRNRKSTSKQIVSRREPVWVDGFGREILLRNMETSHIINCIRVTNKKVVEWEDILSRYAPDSTVGHRQLEIWRVSIAEFFVELDKRAS